MQLLLSSNDPVKAIEPRIYHCKKKKKVIERPESEKKKLDEYAREYLSPVLKR